MDVDKKLEELERFLSKKGVELSRNEIIEAALRLVDRLGAGKVSFLCIAKEMKENG